MLSGAGLRRSVTECDRVAVIIITTADITSNISRYFNNNYERERGRGWWSVQAGSVFVRNQRYEGLSGETQSNPPLAWVSTEGNQD